MCGRPGATACVGGAVEWVGTNVCLQVRVTTLELAAASQSFEDAPAEMHRIMRRR